MAQYKTPLLVVDLKKIRYAYKCLRQVLKGTKLFYAVKANADSRILSELAKLGAHFEIASANEMRLLIRLGIPAQKIIYSNPVKPWQHIQASYKAGVRLFAFDSVGELEKLSKYAPASSLYLRFIVNDQGSMFPLSKKFGVEPQDIVPLMSMARDLGFKPCGLTFHVGSQSIHPRMWESAIKMAGTAMEDLQQYDIILTMLNIGGGFPANYGKEAPSLQLIGNTIAEAVAKYLPYPVELMAEPGRVLVAEAGTLIATVIGRTERAGKNWLYLDISAFNGLMETLETGNSFSYPLESSRSDSHKKTALFTLTGPTCDPQDTMFYDVTLPQNVMIGDKIFIGSAGAYTTAYSSSFNGFAAPKVYYINEDT